MAYNYDLICVGAGPANIALILGALEKYPEAKILLIEKGRSIDKRSCPKAKAGKCVNCQPCQITTGFAGAGTFSDCKLSYSPEVGGTVIDYIGEENFYKYLEKADKMFTDFEGKEEYNYNEQFAEDLNYECSKYGLHLIKNKIRHLGTDGTYEVMSLIQNYLQNFKNVEMKFMTTAKDVNFNNHTVYYELGGISCVATGKYLSIAPGRYGSEWFREICKYNEVKLLNDAIDVGVRIECPASVTDKITDELYEFKIVNWSTTGNKTRSFCVNPGGIVVRENYQDGIACVNGHSYSTNDSSVTNFALLVSSHFTEPFNQPIEYGKAICKLSNMLANDNVMVQRLVDLKDHKRSTKDRMQRLVFKPTLTDAEPGDLRYVLPPNILESILEWLEKADNIMPGINGNQTILYSPEIKFYSSKIDVDNNLMIKGYDNIFALGDGSGVTHGIMQSCISGFYAADKLIIG